MKKYIVIITCLLGLFVSSIRADTNSLFNAKEFGFKLGTDYVVDTSHAFRDDYKFNLNAGVFYFPCKYFGIEANLPFYSTQGPSFSEVQVGAIFRLPLSSSTPILRNFAPYVGLGGVYNWQDSDYFAYVGKAGVEFRLNKKWGVFSEVQYRNNNFEWQRGDVALAGGLKLVL